MPKRSRPTLVDSRPIRSLRACLACCIAPACGSFLLSCERARDDPPIPPDAPNVLLITLDTTRADHLGCYGYSENTSPKLDALAADGVLFTRAISQAAVTPVSHASLFTGLNPYSHGLRVMHGLSQNRLPDAVVTLAKILQSAGYKTAAFVSAFPVTQRFGLHQGFDHFDADFLEAQPANLVSPGGTVNTGRAQRRAGPTTDRALAWLTKATKPYFAWLHYFDPHDPVVQPPDEYRRRIKQVSGIEKEVLRAIYDMEIGYMDEQIGRVFDALRQAGTFERTIIVVLADHGEGLGDHDWWTHGILYQEQVRVPLIFRAPGIAAPRRVDHLVRVIDVMPTVLDLVELDPKLRPPMEGVSLAHLLAGDAPDPGLTAYCDSVNMLTYRFTPRIVDRKNDMLFALIDRPWKYIHHLLLEEQSELYNLDDDPRELTNLLAAHPDVVRRFREELAKRPIAPGKQLEERSPMSPEDIERLRSLGYISGTSDDG